jgi:hypothetical protein
MCGQEMSYVRGNGTRWSSESPTGASWKHLVSRWLGVCVLACAALVCSGHASAQGSVTATPSGDYETLIQQASDAYGAKHFEQARDLFEQAHVLQPSARTFRGLGIAAFALNHYSQARPELEAALVDARKPLPRDQRREVTDILSWMNQSLGTLRLELAPPHAFARIDDRAASSGTNLLELGEHQLVVQATGFSAREQTFLLERDHPLALRVELQHEALAPVASAPEPNLAPAAIPLSSQPQRNDVASESTSVFGRWWFWTIAGVVVASSVVTVWAVTHQPGPRALPQGIRLSTL